MAPEHVREMEDRRPTVRAGVENSKHRLEVAIQVHRRNTEVVISIGQQQITSIITARSAREMSLKAGTARDAIPDITHGLDVGADVQSLKKCC